MKNVIYFIFVIRIKVAFHDSIYQYKSHVINALFIIIGIWWIYTIYGDSQDMYGQWIYNEIDDGYWCETHVAVYGIYLTFIMDTIISSFTLYLFVRPLYLLLKESESTHNDMLLNCVIRYTLLTFITITSTASLLVIGVVVGLGELILFDSVINVFCLLLMTTNYDKYYRIFCKSCHRVIFKCANRPQKKLQNHISMENV